MKQEIKERIELINKGIVPAGYKKTPVGICPVEWGISEIRKFLKIMHGQSQHEVECKNGTYPILGTGGIIGNANSYLYDKPSILIGRKGTIDKPMFIDTPFWTIDTLFYSKIFDNVNIKYLFYIFKIINWLKYDDSTGVPSLSANTIENIKIIVSTNNLEQQKIAEILDCATRQVELQEQLVDKLKVQKKALMQKLLTPQPDWQKLKLKNIINFYNGYSFKSETYVKNGAFYVITISNVKDDGFILQEDTSTIEKIPTDIRDYQILRKGDILISMTGNVGRVCKVECDNCLLNQRVGKIEVKKEFDKNFIFYSLQSYSFVEKMKLLAQGAAQDNMSVKDINNYIIYLPKNKEIQSNISNLLSNIDKRIELQQKLLEQYKLRQKSLMQLLLTGIVRVC